MHRPLHILLTSFGTDGDVFPFIGLGAVLCERGHRVTMVTSEDYRELAGEFGLEFRALNTSEEARAVLTHPDFWDPLKGPGVGAKWGVGFFQRQFELFMELAADPHSVFVASPAIFAARMAAEKLGRQTATIVLQPWLIRSSIEPPVFPLGMTLPRWAPWPAAPIYWRLFDGVGHVLIGRALNRFRKSIGLPPVNRVFQWWLSQQLTIGMFPASYGPPQIDWPKSVRLTGFPMFDGRRPGELSTDVRSFCQAGERPVVFTFGTGMAHCADLFKIALEASNLLNIRAIFLTRYGEQLPSPLPPSVLHANFAPFQELFPLCAAVVHHGGVGTVAKALQAGVPQLAVPIAYDQQDNAARIRRLGVGDWLGSRRRTGRDLANVLERVLSPQVAVVARAIGGTFADVNGLDAAANLIESRFRAS